MIEKYRVSEVAKDLGTPSKELIALLDQQFPAGIEPFVKDLVQEPHHIGKTGGHHFAGIVGHRGGLVHQILIDLRGDLDDLSVPLGLDNDFKLDAAHHAGGGKQTDIPLQQPGGPHCGGRYPPAAEHDVRDAPHVPHGHGHGL